VAWVVLTLKPRRLRVKVGADRSWSDRLHLCRVGFWPNSGRGVDLFVFGWDEISAAEKRVCVDYDSVGFDLTQARPRHGRIDPRAGMVTLAPQRG